MTPILQPSDIDPAAAAALGGKARSLYELAQRSSAQVPGWFAVSADAFRAAVAAAGVGDEIAAALAELGLAGPDRAAVAACMERLAPLCARVTPDEATREAVAQAYRELGAEFVAVRSSALDEDGADHSFAGCMETSLFVRGEDEVLEAVRRCWLSAFSERALAYRAVRGALDRPIAVAVVVQRMIRGDVSGVFFSVDPTTAGGDRSVVTATWGLGEGVVSGRLACDTFWLRRDDHNVVEVDIADKSHAIVYDHAAGAGTCEVELEAEQRSCQVLESAQLRSLSELCGEIERAYGHPVDVEWTWADGQPWILQARPITTVAPSAGVATAAETGAVAGTRKRLWDNSNIIESYSGVTTPLTYSFARHAYSIVYRQALEVLGVSKADIEDNDEVFEQMIGLLNGRVFYSLESWYRLFMLLPGYRFNAEFMEQMMGVSERAEFAPDPRPVSAARKYLLELPRLIAMLTQLSARVARSERLVDDFFDNFNTAYAEVSAQDIESMDYDALVSNYLVAERRLLHRWQAPIVNDILAMVFYGTLRKLTAAWLGDDGALQNDLLCGEGGMESTAPTRDLLRLMERVRGDAALCELLAERSAAEIRAIVGSERRYAWLEQAIGEHVALYGDRCIDELKLETPTLRDDPTFVYGALKAYLAAPPVTVEEMEARERGIRAAAEGKLRAALRRRPDRLRLLSWVLDRARLHVKNRENLRFARTRAFGLVRRFVVQMGDRLARAGRLDDPRDVFHLTLEELIAFSRGTAPSSDLRGLARVRSEEYARYRRLPPPADRMWTHGCVYLDPQLDTDTGDAAEQAGPAAAGDVLRGTAASPGRVRARARLIHDPRTVQLRGEVLVAHRTDPGWVPLFPSAVAVVVERGSVLSHSAIVAREFGIPCVVGVRDALSRLTDGAEVEVNGDAGTVTVL